LPLDKQLKRRQDRETSFDQRQKLLIEDHKWILFKFAPRKAYPAAAENSLRFHPVDEITLLGESFANVGFRISVLDLLHQMPLLVRHFYEELCHFCLSRARINLKKPCLAQFITHVTGKITCNVLLTKDLP